MSKKHNYPKQRRPRNCSYALSYKIYHQIGEAKLREMFSKVGQYLAAAQLTEMMGTEVTPNVAAYLRKRYNLHETNNL